MFVFTPLGIYSCSCVLCMSLIGYPIVMVVRFTATALSVTLLLLLQEECWARPTNYDYADNFDETGKQIVVGDNGEKGRRSLTAEKIALPMSADILFQQLAEISERPIASVKSPGIMIGFFAKHNGKQMHEKVNQRNPSPEQIRVNRVVRNANEDGMSQAGEMVGGVIRTVGEKVSDAAGQASEMVVQHTQMAGTVLGMGAPVVQDAINSAADHVGQQNQMAGHVIRLGGKVFGHGVNAASEAMSQGGEVAGQMVNMAGMGIQHAANAAADVASTGFKIFSAAGGGQGAGGMMGQAANVATQLGQGILSAGAGMMTGGMLG